MSGGPQRHARHGHSHGLPGVGHRRPLAIVLGISATILIVEVIGAGTSGSLALLADAGHVITDVAGLSLSLAAAVGVFVQAEAIRRLIEPSPVASGAMLVFGVVGLADNAASIVLRSKISGGNLNIRAARPEVVNDALGSVAVLMEATPKGVDLARVRTHIVDVPHVQAVHDLHASSVASDLPVLTAHVVVDDPCFGDRHLPRLQQCLAGHFDVEHSTVPFEPASHAAHEHLAHA